MTAIPNRPVDVNNGEDKEHISFNCVSCGTKESIEVTPRGLFDYVVTGKFIQDCFPELTSEQREAIMMGTCIPCTKAIWDNLTGEDD